MKIGVVHVTAEAVSGPYTKLITANFEQAKADDTEILHRFVGHLRRATDTAIAYPTLLNKVDVIAEMVALEHAGADAVFVACSGDTGVPEARSLLTIPVIGPMEAAMSLALGYGWRFGILTVEDPTWSSNMEQMVQAYGLSARYAGLQQLKTPTSVVFTEGFNNPTLVRDDILERARELVAAGAEVICIGSAGLSTFAGHFAISKLENPEVPIFDVLTIGLKFAELRAELHQRLNIPPTSRAGWTAHFTPENRTRVNQLYGWIEENK
jgi:Asp/Glu/hydantoin racemase